ncbi:sigma-70 family RNA polymerase sigma factor [Candidatus Peregrinibacteria bacterium]|nr:sigma-70 family RNA polymerase sigma factor [Candidatus Peregrinibacteria bacterium]
MDGLDLSNKKGEMEHLVDAVKKGDQDAFSTLYDILIGPIYRYIFYRVSRQDAEDLVENVFVKVWVNIHSYKNREGKTFSAWVFRIAHNLIVDYYRKSKNQAVEELSSNIPDVRREHNPIHSVAQFLDSTNLKKALRVLKKPYQDVVIHKFINGFSNAEIAEIMKRSEGSVRILQFRALKILKDELKSLGIKYSF